jgi:transposase
MAHGRMRRKIPQFREALTGHFDDHHAFLCATMLRRIDTLTADIAALDVKVEELIALSARRSRSWMRSPALACDRRRRSSARSA